MNLSTSNARNVISPSQAMSNLCRTATDLPGRSVNALAVSGFLFQNDDSACRRRNLARPRLGGRLARPEYLKMTALRLKAGTSNKLSLQSRSEDRQKRHRLARPPVL